MNLVFGVMRKYNALWLWRGHLGFNWLLRVLRTQFKVEEMKYMSFNWRLIDWTLIPNQIIKSISNLSYKLFFKSFQMFRMPFWSFGYVRGSTKISLEVFTILVWHSATISWARVLKSWEVWRSTIRGWCSRVRFARGMMLNGEDVPLSTNVFCLHFLFHSLAFVVSHKDWLIPCDMFSMFYGLLLMVLNNVDVCFKVWWNKSF